MVREYARALVTHGADSAVSQLVEGQADSTSYNLEEGEMNDLGFACLKTLRSRAQRQSHGSDKAQHVAIPEKCQYV